MPKRWRFLPQDRARVGQLANRLNVSPLMAQVLIARGVGEVAQAKEFLSGSLKDLHPPELLPGIESAAERIAAAVAADRRITIYGDYDVDGVTSTAMLWHCLTLLGARVDYYIPSRLDEGYGINNDAIQKLYHEDPARLLISVDCGICSIDEASLAKRLGLELIITDHHQFGETLPDAACLVHPQLPGGSYPFGDLCGAGVAFKLAWAICKRMHDGNTTSPRMRDFLTDAVGLAAIGTVADVVPLRGENRLIVRFGMRALATRAGAGMKALLAESGIEPGTVPEAESIAYRLGPRINAAGRLGQASLAVELLTTDNSERARTLAEYLGQLNKDRQQVERRMVKEAKELVADNPAWKNDPVLVLAREDWHPGVVGIVASRIAEHYEKPAVLISLENQTAPEKQGKLSQGSARSRGGFDLHAAFEACGEHLATHGGHKAAAGLKIQPAKVNQFRVALVNYANALEEQIQEHELDVDAEVRLSDLTPRAIKELDGLGPFGAQNARPAFVATAVELAAPPKTMGEGGRHLSLLVRQYGATMRVVAFGRADWAPLLAAVKGPLTLNFTAEINRWNGSERVELKLIDWRAEGDESHRESSE